MSKVFYDEGGKVELSDNQYKLLQRVVRDRGSAKITLPLALSFYSGKQAAKDGVNSLKGKGVVEYHKEGVWLVKSLPEELYKRWVE